MAGNQMAGEGASHTAWMQDEALVRYNLPAHLAQLLSGVPSQLQRSDDQHREEIEEYLRTIERLRKRNEDLEGQLGAKEAELDRLQTALYPAKSGLLLKLGGRAASPAETQALLRDLETARLRAQTNESTIQNLEKNLKRYQDRIKLLEQRDKKPVPDSFPLRYRDKSLDLSALEDQAALHDSTLAVLTQVSEDSLQDLAIRVGPLSEDLSERLGELKGERMKLRAEPHTQKSYTPQEAAEKTSIHLTNAAAKEDLLRRQEALKRDLLARWSDWQLAGVVEKQRENLAVAAANARISANEHSASPEDRTDLETLERAGELTGLSSAPALEKTFALAEHLLRLSLAHQKILSNGQSTEPGQADWEKLEAAQQTATNQSEDTLEHILHESGKPKGSLTALKTRRTKLRAAAPSKPAHAVALMELQGEHEKEKKDVFDQTGVRMKQLREGEQDAQNRLRKTLEESESTIATLADLAARDSPAARLAEERANAQSLDQLLALEEEHQTLRSQYLRDLPHMLITKGTVASVLEALKALRADLKLKLRQANQNPALEALAASDPVEAEADRLLAALVQPSGKEAKEQQLYSLHDQLVILINKQLEVQGAGFVPPEDSSKADLAEQWAELLRTIEGIVGLLAEAFHKLTIDDPTTKQELEGILETQKQLKREKQDFPAGFVFANDIIEACKRMLGDTNNLTDVIEKLRDVDDSLIKFQQIMQDNYYKLKPVVGTEEVPGRRRGGRATTFLHITYAEPTNPKEGINILQEMIGTLKKNTDNLFEIESKRVQVVENSLNIKRARDGLQLLQEIEKEEKALRAEDVDVLKTSPNAGEEGTQAAALALEGLEPLEQIPNYAESITFFLKQVMPWLEKSREFDRALNQLIKKVGVAQEPAAAEPGKDPEEGFEVTMPADQIKGAKLPSRNRSKKTKSGRPPASGEAEIKAQSEGPEPLPESLQPVVEKLDIDIEGVFYENQLIIEELLRLFPTHPMAQESEQLKKQHEDVWTKFPDAGDIRKTSATAELLVEWMPKERALLSKLHPQAEDPAEEEAKRGGGMGGKQRQKVKAGKSGAGKADPFKTLKDQQDKLLTDMANLTTQAEADPEDLPARLQAALSDYKEDDQIASMEQRQVLLDEGLTYLTEYYPARVEELSEMITSLETTVTEKEQTVVTVQDDRASEQLIRLQKDMKVKETLMKELQGELNELRAAKEKTENSEELRYKLDKELKAAKAELDAIKKQLNTVTQENQTLQTQKTALERSVVSAASSESQVQHMEKIKTELETSLRETHAQHKAISDKLLAEIATKEAEIAAKEAEIARLQQELSSSQVGENPYLQKYQHQLQKRVMMTLGTTLKFDKAASWLIWKLRAVKKYQAGFSMPPINWTFVSQIPDPQPTPDRQPANNFMFEAARIGVEDGLLYRQFKSTEGQREKPSGMVMALGLMNEVRKRKTVDDREQLGNGKRPPGFPEFLADYCIARSGSQTEGASLCNRLLLALEKMHKQRHSLATFYVRLIRVYHFAPIPYALSLSILQMAETFAPLATARANAQVALGLSPADEDQTGGEALLVPVMDLVLNLFEGQPAASRLVLQGLPGDLMDPAEYLKLKLALGLRRANSTVEKLFGAAPNTDKAGFSALLTGALPQIFGQPEAEKLFSSLSKGPALTKSEAATALAKVNLDELSNNGQLVIPLGVFLLAIADTYHYLLREYVLNAQSLLSSYGWKNVTLENFTQFVNGAGIKASPAAVQSWYDEARGSQPTLTPEGALTTLSKFPLTLGQPLVPAELSAAAVIMLLQETTTRKTVTTVTTVTKKVKVITKK